MKTITRRNFLLGTAGAGALGAGVQSGLLMVPVNARAAQHINLPLPYKDLKTGEPVLDTEDVRRYAFSHYFQGGCMHGAASGLMQAFKEAFSGSRTGWDALPYGMYKYGAGGISGWGTLCGILNGTLAILNLIDLHGGLGHDIMGWYSTTVFPTVNCEGFVAETGEAAIPDDEVLARTVSDSPLCHISISKWCQAAGVSLADKSLAGMNLKNDRCSKICADTAARAAELINEVAVNGSIDPGYETPAHFEDCLACHTESKNQVGKMDCLGCHSPGDAVLVSRRHPDGFDIK